MMNSTFKTANVDSMRRHDIEEVSYEHHERKEESDNYFNTKEPQETLDWKEILGRKFTGVVVKIMSTIIVEVELSPETLEEPFCEKT